MRRKAVPTDYSPDETHPQQPQSRTSTLSNDIPRYTLTDAPVVIPRNDEPEPDMNFEQINGAVLSMQERLNRGEPLSRQSSDPFQHPAYPPSVQSRDSYASSGQATAVDAEPPWDWQKGSKYGPVPQLPTIDSGDIADNPFEGHDETALYYENPAEYAQEVYSRPQSAYVDDYGQFGYGYGSGYAQVPLQMPPSRSPSPEDPRMQEANHTLEYLQREQEYLQGIRDAGAGQLPLNTPSAASEAFSTQHYGPAPSGRVERRNKAKKRVALTNGHLVTELDVPSKMILPVKGEEEMLKTRYTAVTCDPDDFERKGFSLRQNIYGRRTEMFIVVTMYNEDHILLARTLFGIMKNISHLCTRKNSSTWGPDSWKKVVVCIVADGRKVVHSRVLDALASLGVYQEGGHMKNFINEEPVQAHLFEYTTTFALDPELKFRFPDKGIVPTQIIFCLKEKNQKKINSHRWFFNAFAPLLQPNICILLDVGTRPGGKSLYHLWKTFDLNSNVGGACGEIAAYKGKRWEALLNPLVAAQNFEYKMSNMLDKTTESVFGYISVLPGAFSAYRWIAIQNNANGIGPLASYFKGEVLHGHDADLLTSNMYLAEDRILCFELVAKWKSAWVLKYVKQARGTTDVPDALPEFISQRRRWLNGSFFAAIYALAHVGQILQSDHSLGRKALLMIEAGYNLVGLVFAWFAIGNFYIFFSILTSSLAPQSAAFNFFNTVVQYSYAAAIIGCFFLSMGNKPRASPWKYKFVAIYFAVLTTYMLVGTIVCTVKIAKTVGSTDYDRMLVSLIATYFSYLAASLLALDPWHLITSFIQYILLSASYINILNIFAFCNLDDISWGTKEQGTQETDLGSVVQNHKSQVDIEIFVSSADDAYLTSLDNIKKNTPVKKPIAKPSEAQDQQKARDYYANVRTNVLLIWTLSNGILVAFIVSGGVSGTFDVNSSGSHKTRAYMVFILAFMAITSIIRMFGALSYFFIWIFTG